MSTARKPTKENTTRPRWLRDYDKAELAIWSTLDGIRKRSGKRAYHEASEDLLAAVMGDIIFRDGGTKRLSRVLREQEAGFIWAHGISRAQRPSAALKG
jgi:hypothetical protein